jgi:hypothetical protein
MRTVVLTLLCVAAAVAQTNRAGFPEGKAIEVDFSKMQAALKGPHFHTTFYDCKGKKDHAYARQGSVYYACLNQKDVCSEETGVTIPFKLIEGLNAKEREHDAIMAAGQAKLKKAMQEPKMQREPAPRPAAVERTPHSATTTVSQVSAADLAPGAAPAAIADDQLQGVPVGTTRADLIEKLGNPHMKMTGDVEYYTYMLVSGNSALMELQAGKVTKVQVVKAR